MATKRNIRENTAGGWDVLRDGDRRAAITAETQQQALARARGIVRREGGGEVRVVNRAGKIVRASTVNGSARNGRHRRTA